VLTDRAAFVGALHTFAARIDEREARLLQMLDAGPRTLAELVRQRLLYPPRHEELWVDFAEQRSISQHLDELIGAGRVAFDVSAAQYALAAG
jgi:hypothetical protein